MYFNAMQTLFICCFLLVVGRFLTTNIGFLNKYSIPEPIVGGLIFAVFSSLLSYTSDVQISLDVSVRTPLLLMFFCTLGLTANLSLLKSGGPRLIAFVLVLAPFLVLQNLVGVGMAWGLDMHPLMGLIGGSITLVGGHATGTAYAERFASMYNIQDVMALAMTSATLGLVLGGIVGGPVAEYLIKKRGLKPSVNAPDSNTPDGQAPKNTELPSAAAFMFSLCFILFSFVVGSYLSDLSQNPYVSIPAFLWCLLVGVVVRNIGPKLGLHFSDYATEILGALALGIFLCSTMMALDLASVVRVAGPLILILLVQVLFCALYAVFVVFRFVKADYEASVISAAFCGFAMGATATAMANMQAVSRRHGPAPQAFMVVPITGAFLVDILNVIVLTGMLSIPMIAGVF